MSRYRAYDADVEVSVGYALVASLAFALGVVLTVLVSRRFGQENQSTSPAPESRDATIVAPGVSEVLQVLSSSAVVIDNHNHIVQTSAPAVAMGIVKNGELSPESIVRLVDQTRLDGQVREADLVIPVRRRPPIHVHARVAPLNSRLTLVLVNDTTREHQVETIRRDFVANVSHELKTPVGALNLLAEAVGEAADDPEAVLRFSARMHIESDRLTRLVQQIIDLSRLQNDTASDDTSTIKVDELITEAAEHSATEAEGKSISVTTSAQSELFVSGDRAQLHSAVSNLVENAVKYSDPGGKVSIRAERDADDIRITVSDSGVGIDESELDRIFERFYRVDQARARSTGGTGLGLSIVKHVAASNGGTVEVWSKPDLGSTFTLVLPAHDLHEE